MMGVVVEKMGRWGGCFDGEGGGGGGMGWAVWWGWAGWLGG